MLKIIGTKDEIGSLIDALNNTESKFTIYEYIKKEDAVFHVQCRYNYKDLDYMVRLEYEEENNGN